ncbi:leucine-rich receptor-like protein kinase family protein, partial [Striga asiatica]
MGMLTTAFMFVTLVFTQSQAFSSSPENPMKCIERERIALSEFRKSLTDEWGRLSSWTGQECCSWAGIRCSNKTGHVLRLNLHNPTPDTFYNSQDEAYISYYTKSCLRGRLNPAILNLHSLQLLDLSHNNFSASPIPHLLTSKSLHWVLGLSSLRQLNLSGVYLGRAAEWLGPLSGLPSLTKLNLLNTLLSTINPPLSHYYFLSLVSLDLQWNTIDSDSLPDWLFNVTGLVELRLDGNGFRGPIPQEFGELSSLTGTISDGITTNLCNLKYLDLSANDFRGRMPEFGADQNRGEGYCLGDVQIFGASHNSLTRPIPASFILNESIPLSLGRLSNLEKLDVSNNSLSGQVYFSNLLKLTELSNSLVFDVGTNWVPPREDRSNFLQLGTSVPIMAENPERLENDELTYWFATSYSHDMSGNNVSGLLLPKLEDFRRLILRLEIPREYCIPEIVNGIGIERRYTKTMPFLTSIGKHVNSTCRITSPSGSQLATIGAWAYQGNEGPQARRCPSEDENYGDGDSLFPWFYAGIGPGFLVGFMVVCGVLSFV